MLTNPLLRDLIKLFEISNAEISSGDGQHTLGIPAWNLRRYADLTRQQLADWFTLVGYADYCFAPYYEEDVDVEIEVDDSGSLGYRCPETYRWHSVTEDEIAIYTPKTELFLHTIADLLEIPQAFRGGIDKAVIENTLWKLGKVRIGRSEVDVWIAKRFCRNDRAVYTHLERPEIPELGILLTTGNGVSDMLRRPKRFQIVSLLEVLWPSSGAVTFDRSLIDCVITHSVPSEQEPMSPIMFNEFTKTLTLNNHPTPWVIGGEKQVAAIRYMVEQAKKGRWELTAAEILNAAHGGQQYGRSRRMQNLFSGNEVWLNYIHSIKKGVYGFKV